MLHGAATQCLGLGRSVIFQIKVDSSIDIENLADEDPAGLPSSPTFGLGT